MALREIECYLVRRVADRGIDKNIGNSRAHGDRFNRDRRFADRGNGIGSRDPRDIIEIKRLRQRVQDLEEIKRLRQRVRDLELQREMRVKEIESRNVVWDDVDEEEEYPFYHPQHRFFKPIYQESLRIGEPDLSNVVWDESDDEKEATDECLKIYKESDVLASFGNTMVKGDPADLLDDRKVSLEVEGHCWGSSTFGSKETTELNEKSLDDLVSKIWRVEGDEGEGCGHEVATLAMVAPSFRMDEKEFLWMEGDFTKLPINQEFQNGIDSQLAIEKYFAVCHRDTRYVNLNFAKVVDNINNGSPHKKCSMVEKDIFKNKNIEVVYDKKASYGNLVQHADGAISMQCGRTRTMLHINNIGLIRFTHSTLKNNIQNIYFGSILLRFIVLTANSRPTSKVNKKQPNAPFDPGGSSSIQSETTCEVNQCSWIVTMLINGDRVSVPFDPGDYDPESKLEDEFFSKKGRMMQS